MSYHLFEVYGVELEYMIADRDTLKVRPIADELIREMTGDYLTDVERGRIAWSNELVAHVIELKTNGPSDSLLGLDGLFYDNIKEINHLLEKHNAMLLPTGAHPMFDPLKETVIWPHEYNEVYSLYNRIFNCKGHGWSNLQSTHINLPFSGNEEFERLHAAIRCVMPLIPALAASTPIIDGKATGFLDTRLEYYRKNQHLIPVIAGKVIPEAVYSHSEYIDQIFTPIKKAIAPFDQDNILDHHFLNSRGAIARFDRGAIEIRIIDIQECPKADIALLDFYVAVIKQLVNEKWAPLKELKPVSTDVLAEFFLDVVRDGRNATVPAGFPSFVFGLDREGLTAGDLLSHLYDACHEKLLQENASWVKTMLEKGSLSERILQAMPKTDLENITAAYRELASCLAENRMFGL